MTTTTMTREQIAKRIKEIEATPRALVGSDEGTHGKPLTCRVYEEITGERYAVSSFGGDNGNRCTIEEATAKTAGRIRLFPNATAAMRSLQRELAELRRLARS